MPELASFRVKLVNFSSQKCRFSFLLRSLHFGSNRLINVPELIIDNLLLSKTCSIVFMLSQLFIESFLFYSLTMIFRPLFGGILVSKPPPSSDMTHAREDNAALVWLANLNILQIRNSNTDLQEF